MRKILSMLAASALLVVGMSAPAFAAYDPNCVATPAVDAYDETVTAAFDDPDVSTPQPDTYIEHEAVKAVTERVNYVWTGGPVEGAPAVDSDHWNSNPGEHSGNPFDQPDGVPFQVGNGNGDWFLWKTVVVTPAVEARTETVHHDPVVTKGQHHDAVIVHHDAVPAVVCDAPPVVVHYGPNNCVVHDTVRITGDGVLTVTGNWDEDSIDVTSQFSAAEGGLPTITSIGPSLNIDATPLQYVGIHIQTARGTIVFEEEPSYGGNLWSNVAWPGVPAGMGYPAFGTYQQFNDLNGGTAITGVSILYTHPQASSTKVKSFTVGCVTFKFKPVKHPQPTPEPTTPVTEPTVPAVVTPAPVVEPVVAAPVAAPVATPVVAAPAATTTPPATLASTGMNTWWGIAIAGTLTLLGYAMFMVAAKRRHN